MPPPSSRIRLIYALEFSRLLSHKTWCENFSLLVWETKNSRATTKKFSHHFFQRYCCPVKFLQLLTIRDLCKIRRWREEEFFA
ncbi:DUF1661 domain-containing protein [Porphyromonas gingivalis]|uniref:DUF1661 domain-containing protein n=1 Tax=Porphyromonas gingivalis TaxID=837 RepID=UPI001E58D316|nr:DUF1661 domain-containing protein [Porphyromonas gingivalis]